MTRELFLLALPNMTGRPCYGEFEKVAREKSLRVDDRQCRLPHYSKLQSRADLVPARLELTHFKYSPAKRAGALIDQKWAFGTGKPGISLRALKMAPVFLPRGSPVTT